MKNLLDKKWKKKKEQLKEMGIIKLNKEMVIIKLKERNGHKKTSLRRYFIETVLIQYKSWKDH